MKITESNIKLYLNTPPRTGSHFLLFNMITDLNIDQKLVLKTHTTKYFVDNKTITITRDPKECIVSLCSMLRTTRNYPIDFPLNSILESDISNTSYKSASIVEQIKYYKDFYIKSQQSINTILPFTFEQVTENKDLCNETISKYFNIQYRDLPKKYVYEGRKNVLLTSKDTGNYKAISDNISEFDQNFDSLYKEYYKLISLVKIRQKEIGMI